ncbi:MAG: ABC transporter permease [Thermoclostridium sp.]|nr:ABC transporter permease [Thermoclostridium sp.]
MKPLSVFTYFLNNKKSVYAVFIAISLSVFLLYSLQIIINSTWMVSELAFVEPQKHYSSITPKGALLDTQMVESIREWDCVEKVIPWVFQYINFTIKVGGDTGTKVFTLYQDDMEEMITLLDLKLIEGSLPSPDKNEIAVHEQLARNKGLKIGDSIGSHVERDEALKGEYKIVGILDGKSIVSFASLEKWMKNNEVYDPFRFGIIILPKPERFEEMNLRLEYLPATDLDLRTLSLVRLRNQENARGLFIVLNLINLMVILIVSICVGFLTYIYMYQRRVEFGLLNAIGYTRQEVLSRSFKEIITLCFSGYAFGVLLSMISGIILYWTLFYPKGQGIRLWNLDYFLNTACIPLFATLFSIIPVWNMLTGLDPVTILEGGMTDAD